jgi:hypothetical protein
MVMRVGRVMIASLACVGVLLGCNAFSKELVSGDAPATISIQDVPDSVTEVTLRIDGPGMSPIERTVSRGEGAVAIFVPTGEDRTFTASAAGYYARETVGVPPGGLSLSLRLFARPVSTFDSGAEGWSTFGVTRNFRWGSEGFIYAEDNGGGTYFYFLAGPGFLGDRSDRYGAALSFELRTNITGADGFADIVIEGADFRIVYDFGSELPVANTWTPFSATVSESAGWLRQEISDGSPSDVQTLPGTPATEADIRAVLSDVRELYIRGEYSTGADETSLDNVRW